MHTKSRLFDGSISYKVHCFIRNLAAPAVSGTRRRAQRNPSYASALHFVLFLAAKPVYHIIPGL